VSKVAEISDFVGQHLFHSGSQAGVFPYRHFPGMVWAMGQQRERSHFACLSFAFYELTALFLLFHFLPRCLSGHGPNRVGRPLPHRWAILCFQQFDGFVPAFSFLRSSHFAPRTREMGAFWLAAQPSITAGAGMGQSVRLKGSIRPPRSICQIVTVVDCG